MSLPVTRPAVSTSTSTASCFLLLLAIRLAFAGQRWFGTARGQSHTSQRLFMLFIVIVSIPVSLLAKIDQGSQAPLTTGMKISKETGNNTSSTSFLQYRLTTLMPPLDLILTLSCRMKGKLQSYRFLSNCTFCRLASIIGVKSSVWGKNDRSARHMNL